MELSCSNYLRFKVKLDWRGNYVYDADGDKIITPVREAMPALLAIDWAAIIVDEAHQTLAGATGNVKTNRPKDKGLGCWRSNRMDCELHCPAHFRGSTKTCGHPELA